MPTNANDLILFAHVMEAGSFTQAAERTNLPISTISRRIAELENDLGERLMTRTTRQLQITDFGEGILEYAQRLLEESEAASAFALNRQATPQGKLRVSMPPEFEEFSVIEFTKRFLDSYPQVDLHIDLSTRRVDLQAERYDLAIRIAKRLPDDANLVARKLAVLKHYLYASPSYIEKFGMPQKPDDLLKAQGVLVADSYGDPNNWKLHKGSESNGNAETWVGRSDYRVSSNSVALNLGLALAGLGVIANSELFASRYVSSGQLIKILPDWSLSSLSVWAVTSGRRLLPTRTQAFIDMFRETIEDLVA